MTEDMHRAAAILTEGNFTCVLCRSDLLLTDTRRGI